MYPPNFGVEIKRTFQMIIVDLVVTDDTHSHYYVPPFSFRKKDHYKIAISLV